SDQAHQAPRPGVSEDAPSAASAAPGAPAGPPSAFGFLVAGVAACMREGVAPAGNPVRVATNVWTALHGMVSLRQSNPLFAWPPLAEQVDDALSAFVGLDRASLASDAHT